MSQPHYKYFGYWLYYDDATYSDTKDGLNYLGKLDESQIKTLFDAAKYDGESSFKSAYGYDYKIMYDFSQKTYSIAKR